MSEFGLYFRRQTIGNDDLVVKLETRDRKQRRRKPPVADGSGNNPGPSLPGFGDRRLDRSWLEGQGNWFPSGWAGHAWFLRTGLTGQYLRTAENGNRRDPRRILGAGDQVLVGDPVNLRFGLLGSGRRPRPLAGNGGNRRGSLSARSPSGVEINGLMLAKLPSVSVAWLVIRHI